MKKSNHRIMFLRDKSGQPVGCIAIVVSEKKSRVRYQISVLNPSDKFDRDLARHIALGRLVEKPFEIKLNGQLNQIVITKEVMNALKANEGVPMRARKAATLWLDSIPTDQCAGYIEIGRRVQCAPIGQRRAP
jgi:hypothetical protein